MRLLTSGIVFETIPETVTLPPSSSVEVNLCGTPIEIGVLEVQGYSTHTLGVKSNCRLKHMRDRSADLPQYYSVDVIPALPNLSISASLQHNANATINNDAGVANLTLYNGETMESILTITNNSNIAIDFLEESVHSGLDSRMQSRIFQWSNEQLQQQLPLQPKQSINLDVTIFGDADFLGPVNIDISPPVGMSSLASSAMYAGSYHADGTTSLLGGMSSLSMSGHASLPSRVSSPTPTNIHRRTELTSSFRSNQSAHSSLATGSIGQTFNNPAIRQIEGKFQIRYSGGEGFQEGYCRQNSFTFNLELLPSAQITHWDVLPAEMYELLLPSIDSL